MEGGDIMMRRSVTKTDKHYRGKMRPSQDKRVFSTTAAHVRGVNLLSSPMRGGIRL